MAWPGGLPCLQVESQKDRGATRRQASTPSEGEEAVLGQQPSSKKYCQSPEDSLLQTAFVHVSAQKQGGVWHPKEGLACKAQHWAARWAPARKQQYWQNYHWAHVGDTGEPSAACNSSVTSLMVARDGLGWTVLPLASQNYRNCCTRMIFHPFIRPYADAYGFPWFPQGRAHQCLASRAQSVSAVPALMLLTFPCLPDLNPIKHILDAIYRIIHCRHIAPGADWQTKPGLRRPSFIKNTVLTRLIIWVSTDPIYIFCSQQNTPYIQ